MKKLLVSLFAVALLAGCGSSGDSGKVEGKINVFTRDSTSGTREAFEKGVGFEKELTQNATEVQSNDDMAAKVGGDLNGIGYTSLSTDFEKNNVKALKFEGVVASSDTVLDGTYGLQRPFNFVTRAKGDFGSDEKEQLAAAFLDFLQNSEEGMQVVKAAGGEVDLKKATAWEELAKKHPIVNQDNSSIELRTCGSTSVDKTLKAALEAFSPMAGNFKYKMNQNGSGDATKRVLGSEKDGANAADIGFASREFKTDGTEDTANALAVGQYCLDAVVAVVNKDNNDFDSLTKAQLKDIFTGKSVNWEDVK